MVQIMVNAGIGFVGLPVATGLGAMSGYATAQYHSMTLGFIILTVIPSALQLLAACNIGITARGSVYLALAVAASAVQVLVAILWGPLGWCVAVVIVVLAIVAAVNGRAREDKARIAARPRSRGRVVADIVIAVASTILLIALIVLNDQTNDLDNRRPAREFDSSEASERLDGALAPILAALAEVEGMPDPRRDFGGEQACMDGGHEDPDWIEFEVDLQFEDPKAVVNISPYAGAGARAIEAVKASLIENGWEISDERVHSRVYDLYAEREDGIRIGFEVGAGMTRLWATTGCVRNADNGQD
ncbi:hypothetical protein AB0B28_03525 [Glycomyces sp. NPDC046736]|uniref:hypothetical protein n=1 Tax=Glycomyces sp. NPDC046736 TaxID=3155615 RepID=UPI0033DC8839